MIFKKKEEIATMFWRAFLFVHLNLPWCVRPGISLRESIPLPGQRLFPVEESRHFLNMETSGKPGFPCNTCAPGERRGSAWLMPDVVLNEGDIVGLIWGKVSGALQRHGCHVGARLPPNQRNSLTSRVRFLIALAPWYAPVRTISYFKRN